MKNFITTFLITLTALYTFASFVAWDITTVTDWHPVGRFAFMTLALFISVLTEATKENNK